MSNCRHKWFFAITSFHSFSVRLKHKTVYGMVEYKNEEVIELFGFGNFIFIFSISSLNCHFQFKLKLNVEFGCLKTDTYTCTKKKQNEHSASMLWIKQSKRTSKQVSVKEFGSQSS